MGVRGTVGFISLFWPASPSKMGEEFIHPGGAEKADELALLSGQNILLGSLKPISKH